MSKEIIAYVWATVMALLALVAAAKAEEIVVSEFTDGVLTWTNSVSNGCYTVEWASSLSEGKWNDNWDAQSRFSSTGMLVSASVPLFYRVKAKIGFSFTNAPVCLCPTNGSRQYFQTVTGAYAAASAGDTIFMQAGVYNIGYFGIFKDGLKFIGSAMPHYDLATSNLYGGVIWFGETRICGTAVDHTFVNVGFQGPSGSDVLLSGTCSTNERRLVMRNCLFAGSGNNAHNLEINGTHVRLDNCASYNGGHNFAFKCQELDLNNIYSYNGRGSGVIIKSSEAVGDVMHVNANNIMIEGPVGGSSAKGLYLNGYDEASEMKYVTINNLTTRNVDSCIYLYYNGPYPGFNTKHIRLLNCTGYNSYSTYGDFLVHANVDDVVFVNCRSVDCKKYGFRNMGSGRVSVIGGVVENAVAGNSHGTFEVLQINNEFY